MRPPFIRVIPDEVDQYGAAAAAVLAHIRYRCETDGPGRIERNGFRWWRVSHEAMGVEIGLSARSVRTALRALGEAVTANHFPPLANQSLAYRATAEREPVTSQSTERSPSDQPVDRTVIPDDRTVEVPRPNGHLPTTERSSALLIETLEKGGEGGAALRPDATPPPPPRSANSNALKTRPRCARHAHIADDADVPSCPDCRDARLRDEASQRADADRAAAERADIRRAIDKCHECDDYGRDLLDSDVDCPHHPNFRQLKATTW